MDVITLSATFLLASVAMTFCISIMTYLANCFASHIHRNLFMKIPVKYTSMIIFKSIGYSIIFPIYWYKFHINSGKLFAFHFNKIEQYLLDHTPEPLCYDILDATLKKYRPKSRIRVLCTRSEKKLMIDLLNDFFKTNEKYNDPFLYSHITIYSNEFKVISNLRSKKCEDHSNELF